MQMHEKPTDKQHTEIMPDTGDAFTIIHTLP